MIDRTFDDRLTLHDIGQEDLQSLVRLSPALDPLWESVADDLFRHLRRFGATSRLLASDELMRRLKATQVQHYREMLTGRIDEAYAERRWRVGAVHHRIQLGPMWYLGSYARVISYLADDLNSLVKSGQQHEVLSFLKTIFLDISLSVESYNLSEDRQLLDTSARRSPQRSKTVDSTVDSREAPTPIPKKGQRARLMEEGELGVRLSFFECYDDHTEALSQMREQMDEMIRFTVKRFYTHFANHSLTAPILGNAEDLDRLMLAQAEHLKSLFDGRLDRPFAASRLFVGATHERIGLAPHLYLAGVGLQLVSMVEFLVSYGQFSASRLRGIASLFLFDASLILDAYLEARRETLLRADSYAAALLERLPTGVVVLDSDRRIVSANQALLIQFDLKGDILRGLTVSQAFPSLYLDEYVTDVMTTNSPVAPILCESTGTSDRRLYRVIAVRLPQSRGHTLRLALLIDDMTDLKRAGESAGQAETRWFDLISDVEAVVWEADPETMQLQLVAGHAMNLIGHPPEELLADTTLWHRAMSDEGHQKWADAIQDARTRHDSFRLEHRSASFADKWLQSTVRVTRPDDGNAVLRGVTVDVTRQVDDRVLAERRLVIETALAQLGKTLLQLRDRSSMLSAAFDSLASLFPDDALLVYSRGNDGHLKLKFGQPQGIAELGSLYDPSSSPPSPESPSPESLSPESPSNESESTNELNTATERQQLKWELLGSGGKVDVVILALSASPSTERDEDRSGAFAILTRFLELALHRAESERANLQNQKMVALGTFAGGVAHDFNNTLASVVLTIDVLRQFCDFGEDMISVLDELLGRVDKSKQTIKQIIAFSRLTPVERTTVNLSSEVMRICHHQQAIYPLADVKTEIAEGLRVRFAAAQLEHIVLNLLDNAIQATGSPRADVRVQLRKATLVSPQPVDTGVLPPAEYAVLSVQDFGPGIPSEIRSQIFDPFFTTKDVGTGTGLGLAIVHGYVTEAGGGLNVVTSPEGTQMEAYLPLVPQEQQSDGDLPTPSHKIDQPVRILIVDDEPGLATLTQKALSIRGHQTESRTDASEALTLLQESPDAYDFVIVDYWMPKMNGLEFIGEARRIGVRAKFILLSGFLDSNLKDSADAIGAMTAAKPLSASAIESLINDIN